MQNNNKTINILGAGPAGLSAAIHLAQHDRSVVVHEKNDDIARRFHNELQGVENWSSGEDLVGELRRMSINLDFLCKPISKGIVQGPSVRADIRSKIPLFYLIKRGGDEDSLDCALRKQAQDLGVEIIYRTSTTAADCDIIATGPSRANIFAQGHVFETCSADAVIALIDDRVAPKGYAYLLIVNGQGTLVITHFGRAKDASPYLDRAAAKFHELHDFDVRNPRPFAGSGGFSLPSSAMRSGKLLAGEAAGFQDFLFGFGTRYALVSGHLAARSIIEGTSYDALWKEKFGRRLKVSAMNRRIYELFGERAYDYFINAIARSNRPGALLAKCYTRSLLWLPFA